MKPSTSDLEYRRGLAWSAFRSMERIWKARHIDLTLKVRIFEASVQSILLYGCESWLIDQKLESRINTFATSCYREILDIRRFFALARIFALYVPERGKAKRGRPRPTYLNQIASLLTTSPDSITTENIVDLANNRTEWSKRTAAFQAKID